MIDRLWAYHLELSLGPGREVGRKAILGEVEHWCRQRPNGDDVLAEFHHLASR